MEERCGIGRPTCSACVRNGLVQVTYLMRIRDQVRFGLVQLNASDPSQSSMSIMDPISDALGRT